MVHWLVYAQYTYTGMVNKCTPSPFSTPPVLGSIIKLKQIVPSVNRCNAIIKEVNFYLHIAVAAILLSRSRSFIAPAPPVVAARRQLG